MKRLDASGFAHHLLLLVVVIAAIASVGTMVLRQTKAATSTAMVPGTSTICGSNYRNYEVWNANYTTATKNSDSVRNLAKELCVRGFLSNTIVKSINQSGNWSPALQDALKKFQQSKPALQNMADGKPTAMTVCLLGDASYTDKSTAKTYHSYSLQPKDFPVNDCFELMNTEKAPA